ncbi:putative adhesin [Candidatus Termititenax aidoneus]|uniref:Adhesin n=1 Tax=Termititenax aidoneus TaxID=2218524 RepID=A0A388TBZ3_TERA1|nr:putative adhesin [Candidatus Termititenax aidoneus]
MKILNTGSVALPQQNLSGRFVSSPNEGGYAISGGKNSADRFTQYAKGDSQIDIAEFAEMAKASPKDAKEFLDRMPTEGRNEFLKAALQDPSSAQATAELLIDLANDNKFGAAFTEQSGNTIESARQFIKENAGLVFNNISNETLTQIIKDNPQKLGDSAVKHLSDNSPERLKDLAAGLLKNNKPAVFDKLLSKISNPQLRGEITQARNQASVLAKYDKPGISISENGMRTSSPDGKIDAADVRNMTPQEAGEVLTQIHNDPFDPTFDGIKSDPEAMKALMEKAPENIRTKILLDTIKQPETSLYTGTKITVNATGGTDTTPGIRKSELDTYIEAGITKGLSKPKLGAVAKAIWETAINPPQGQDKEQWLNNTIDNTYAMIQEMDPEDAQAATNALLHEINSHTDHEQYAQITGHTLSDGKTVGMLSKQAISLVSDKIDKLGISATADGYITMAELGDLKTGQLDLILQNCTKEQKAQLLNFIVTNHDDPKFKDILANMSKANLAICATLAKESEGQLASVALPAIKIAQIPHLSFGEKRAEVDNLIKSGDIAGLTTLIDNGLFKGISHVAQQKTLEDSIFKDIAAHFTQDGEFKADGKANDYDALLVSLCRSGNGLQKGADITTYLQEKTKSWSTVRSYNDGEKLKEGLVASLILKETNGKNMLSGYIAQAKELDSQQRTLAAPVAAAPVAAAPVAAAPVAAAPVAAAPVAAAPVAAAPVAAAPPLETSSGTKYPGANFTIPVSHTSQPQYEVRTNGVKDKIGETIRTDKMINTYKTDVEMEGIAVTKKDNNQREISISIDGRKTSVTFDANFTDGKIHIDGESYDVIGTNPVKFEINGTIHHLGFNGKSWTYGSEPSIQSTLV